MQFCIILQKDRMRCIYRSRDIYSAAYYVQSFGPSVKIVTNYFPIIIILSYLIFVKKKFICAFMISMRKYR